jgi:serine protease Do
VVTNAHVVGDNASVVVEGEELDERLVRVVYLDTFYDLAFLGVEPGGDYPQVVISEEWPAVGTPVEVCWPFERRGRSVSGRVRGSRQHHEQTLLSHDGRAGRTVAGAALFGQDGQLLGINMQDDPEHDDRSLALPAVTLAAVLREFAAGRGKPGTRCFDCRKLVFEQAGVVDHCPHCGNAIVLPSQLRDAEPVGINATLEDILRAAGHDPRLARRGPNLWIIQKGSASIHLTYHEESGLVTGDAYLCRLPEAAGARVYAYLLRENARMRQLTFSTYGRDIILSLLIYDRYLTVDTALPRFTHLFERADAYDDVLVREYGAVWIS